MQPQRTPKRVLVAPNLYKRPKDGKYEVGFTGPDGKWHLKTLRAENLTRAKREQRAFLTDRDRGEVAIPTRMTFGDVAASCFQVYHGLVAGGERKPRTLLEYRQRYASHIAPRLGHLQIQKITSKHVGDLLAGLATAGLSSNTRKNVFAVLKVMFDHALTRGLIVQSPLARLAKAEKPKGKSKQQPRTLTNDECATLISSAASGWRTFIATAVDTGMRQSELLGLRWQDVDLARSGEDTASTIHVRHQLSRASASQPAKLELPKAGGVRDIWISAELAQILRSHKMASRFKTDGDYVFATDEGCPRGQRNAHTALTNAARRAGLNSPGKPSLKLHHLRHTAISRWIAAGLDVATVSALAGHSDPTTTLRVYTREWERARRSQDVQVKLAATGVGAAIARGI
jgi:integrase